MIITLRKEVENSYKRLSARVCNCISVPVYIIYMCACAQSCVQKPTLDIEKAAQEVKRRHLSDISSFDHQQRNFTAQRL